MASNRLSRIAAAFTGLQTKLAERASLRAQLTAVTSKWEALKAATYWAELDSGASIAVGDSVRYFGRNYTCIKAHTKALLRLPTNAEYWTVQPDN